MASRRRGAFARALPLTFASAIAFVGAGCGKSVHDLSISSDPLLIIHGHVDTTSLARLNPDAPLIGGLVWAGLASVSPLCLKFDDPGIAPACPDPYGVFYGEIELAAPVDADGNFSLPLFHLPKVSVSIGDDVTRIAYGSLLVAEDTNGDGQLSFVPPPGFRRDGGGGINQPKTPPPDVIVAASFTTLQAPQTRVVFREGGFVEDSFFYPMPGCGTPPPGFSIATAPPYSDTPAAPGDCTFAPADTTTEVPALAATDALALMCRPVQRSLRIIQPQSDEPPSTVAKSICLTHDYMASVLDGLCPVMASYALVGCRQDPFCSPPDWNHSSDPPPWWPCQ